MSAAVYLNVDVDHAREAGVKLRRGLDADCRIRYDAAIMGHAMGTIEEACATCMTHWRGCRVCQSSGAIPMLIAGPDDLCRAGAALWERWMAAAREAALPALPGVR